MKEGMRLNAECQRTASTIKSSNRGRGPGYCPFPSTSPFSFHIFPSIYSISLRRNATQSPFTKAPDKYKPPKMASKPEHHPFLDHSDSDDGFSDSQDQTRENSVADGHECGGFARQKSLPFNTTILSHLLSVFITTSALWVVIILISLTTLSSSANRHSHSSQAQKHNITSSMTLLTCGESIAQAKKLGCKYDVELNAWIRPQCFNTKAMDQYLDDKSWTAYSDQELTQKVAPEEMGDTELYFTSERDHINHCVGLWRRQFKLIFEEADAIDALSANPHHTNHCAGFLLDMAGQLPGQFTNSTRVYPGKTGCWVRK